MDKTEKQYANNRSSFDGKDLCLSGKGITKIFGVGNKKCVAVDNVDFEFMKENLFP